MTEARKPRVWASAFLFFLSYGVLIPGLIAPLFTVKASIKLFGMEMPVLNITKSTMGTVHHLYSEHYPLPATLILIFSVLLPFVKLAAMLWAFRAFRAGGRTRLVDSVRTVSKWATVDAFTVMTFAGFLAGHNNTEFTLHVGFYCFFSYCLLSVAAAMVFPDPATDLYGETKTIALWQYIEPLLIAAAWGICLTVPVINLKVPKFGIDDSLSFTGLVIAMKSSQLSLTAAISMVLVGALPALEAVCGIIKALGLELPSWTSAIEHCAMLDVFIISMVVTSLASQGMSDQLSVGVLPMGRAASMLVTARIAAVWVPGLMQAEGKLKKDASGLP